MASRGISPIQEKARGKKMAKKMPFGGKESDPRKAAAPKRSKKSSLSIKAKAPLDSMSAGAASSLPMPPAAGLRPGMKKGGSCGAKMACGGSMKGYFKGGSVDGAVKKGHTRGKMC